MSDIKNFPEHDAALRLLNSIPEPTVSESDFVENYLGLLCGEVKTGEIAALWSDGVCGGRDSSVLILDANGKPKDRVPPLLMPYPTEFKFNRRRSISAIMAETQLTNRSNPIMANRFMEDSLTAHVDSLFEVEAVKTAAAKHRQSWVEFLARWGKKVVEQESTNVESAQASTDQPDGFEEL